VEGLSWTWRGGLAWAQRERGWRVVKAGDKSRNEKDMV
jgi:hypothetical protein